MAREGGGGRRVGGKLHDGSAWAVREGGGREARNHAVEAQRQQGKEEVGRQGTAR